jgi:hypothetical protein
MMDNIVGTNICNHNFFFIDNRHEVHVCILREEKIMMERMRITTWFFPIELENENENVKDRKKNLRTS